VRYRVDPERSEVSAVLRPRLDGTGPLAAVVSGTVDVPSLTGSLQLAVGGRTVDLDVAGTVPELDTGRDGEVLLRGSAERPAGAFGLTGPPLLNPTVLLRWRAVLVPGR